MTLSFHASSQKWNDPSDGMGSSFRFYETYSWAVRGLIPETNIWVDVDTNMDSDEFKVVPDLEAWASIAGIGFKGESPTRYFLTGYSLTTQSSQQAISLL